jgi:hypothetical protein
MKQYELWQTDKRHRHSDRKEAVGSAGGSKAAGRQATGDRLLEDRLLEDRLQEDTLQEDRLQEDRLQEDRRQGDKEQLVAGRQKVNRHSCRQAERPA